MCSLRPAEKSCQIRGRRTGHFGRSTADLLLRFNEMAGRQKVDDARLEAEAAAIVEEVLRPWKKYLTDDELLVMRAALEGELLVDPDGRLELRRMLADPEVDESDQIARRPGGEQEEDEAAKGNGG